VVIESGNAGIIGNASRVPAIGAMIGAACAEIPDQPPRKEAPAEVTGTQFAGKITRFHPAEASGVGMNIH
jgi:hypothetical protein